MDDEAKRRHERAKEKEREKRAAAAKLERERLDNQKKQQAKKKRKNRRGKDEDADDLQDDSDEEDVEPNEWPREEPKKDGGISKRTMVVESVKGKVSTANKNLTDADLERRFSLHDGSGGDAGSLMTEEQVLRIIRREKQERGGATERGGASASRRVQRELDEWADKKAQQRARVKSPHRFERMVIARK